MVKFKVGEAGNVGGRVDGGATVIVLAMLSCGSLLCIDTGGSVASVSPSLHFGGVSPIIFFIFCVAVRRMAVTFYSQAILKY